FPAGGRGLTSGANIRLSDSGGNWPWKVSPGAKILRPGVVGGAEAVVNAVMLVSKPVPIIVIGTLVWPDARALRNITLGLIPSTDRAGSGSGEITCEIGAARFTNSCS